MLNVLRLKSNGRNNRTAVVTSDEKCAFHLKVIFERSFGEWLKESEGHEQILKEAKGEKESRFKLVILDF